MANYLNIEPPDYSISELRAWAQNGIPALQTFSGLQINMLEETNEKFVSKMPPWFQQGTEVLKDWMKKNTRISISKMLNLGMKGATAVRTSEGFVITTDLNQQFKEREKDIQDSIKPVLSLTAQAYGMFWGIAFAETDEPFQAQLDKMIEVYRQRCEVDPQAKSPITPLFLSFFRDKTSKRITPEYDRKHPVTIIDRASMGSIRDVIMPRINSGEEIGELKGISAPAPEAEQLIIPECAIESKLPAVLPLEAIHMSDGITTTKRGAVSMPIRLFFEAIMSLDPKETQADIRFQLGDLLRYLNPNGKYNRTNHLPYVLKGLHNLYFLRIPYREKTDKPSTEVDWIPVLPRTVPNAQSGDDASIILEVKLPPDASSGMMVEKEILRLTGKHSSAKFNAYLSACWIFDRYGTTKKGIIDPTKPIEYRDRDGNLLKRDGTPIFDSRGKRTKNPYHTDAVTQLDRETNPTRKRYPILSFEDLVRACFPKGNDQSKWATYRKRALSAWNALETDGIVRIERYKHGLRILPSESHIGHYRAVDNVY